MSSVLIGGGGLFSNLRDVQLVIFGKLGRYLFKTLLAHAKMDQSILAEQINVL